MGSLGTDVDMGHVLSAKELLNSHASLRSIVQEVEQNMKSNTFLIKYNDVSKLAKAYTTEMSQFIDVAQTENKRILNKTNLL